MRRAETRRINVGGVSVGRGAPISVQSMTTTDTRDVEATVRQIERLRVAGCEIVRVAVPDAQAAEALATIKSRIKVPLVADIHFDYRLALKAIEGGVDKLRINPGNIGSRWKVELVTEVAKDKGVPIRIGVNAGSLERRLYQKYGGITPEALVESALEQVAVLESLGFEDMVISLKASDVPLTLEVYRLISREVDYPLHLGISEAGPLGIGGIRSAVGIGALLAEGIGDTIRVSLTADPVEEVLVGYEILKALGLRERGPTIISCPTCGRMEINLIPIVEEVEKRVRDMKQPIKVAVMGCVVNGPGEAREADVGIAGGKGVGLLFRKGKVVRKVKEEEMVEALIREMELFK